MDPPWIDGPPEYRCECGMLATFQCPLCRNIYCGNCGLDCSCHKIFERARGRRCSACKAECDPSQSSWRIVGDRFEHHCPDSDPQAGYFEDEAADVRDPSNCDDGCSECLTNMNWQKAFEEYDAQFGTANPDDPIATAFRAGTKTGFRAGLYFETAERAAHTSESLNEEESN